MSKFKLLLSSCLLLLAFAPVAQASFGDVPHGHWAFADVIALEQRDVIVGKSRGVFAPNDNVTKAEFVKMVLKTAGIDENDIQEGCSYGNMDEQAWFYNYMYTACVMDLVKTPVTSQFIDAHYPNQEITRGDAAVILMRITNPNQYIEVSDGGKFQDVNSDSAYWPYVVTAGFYEIFRGYEETGYPFKLNNKLTRAEAAVIINRAHNAFFTPDALHSDTVSPLTTPSSFTGILGFGLFGGTEMACGFGTLGTTTRCNQGIVTMLLNNGNQTAYLKDYTCSATELMVHDESGEYVDYETSDCTNSMIQSGQSYTAIGQLTLSEDVWLNGKQVDQWWITAERVLRD
jgi:hypothetical protein